MAVDWFWSEDGLSSVRAGNLLPAGRRGGSGLTDNTQLTTIQLHTHEHLLLIITLLRYIMLLAEFMF